MDESWSPRLTPQLEEALRSLRREALAAELGELLSEGQIEALLKRRDEILERISSSP